MSPRPEAALRLLGKTGTLADIGCDHGKFGAAALERGLADKVIAGDISAPSLRKAGRLAEKEGLSARMELRLCSGFSAFEPGEADAAVLLGMGGELIVSILEASPAVVRSLERIVMQPMRGEAELRRYLYLNGFAVLDEAVTFDNGRYYQLIAAKYCPGEAAPLPDYWPKDYYQFGPKAFSKREENFLPLLERYRAIMEKKLAAARKNGRDDPPPALVFEESCTAELIRLYHGREGSPSAEEE